MNYDYIIIKNNMFEKKTQSIPISILLNTRKARTSQDATFCAKSIAMFLRSTLRQVLYDIKKNGKKTRSGSENGEFDLWKWSIWPPSYGPIRPIGFWVIPEVRQRECSNIADGSDSPSSGDYT